MNVSTIKVIISIKITIIRSNVILTIDRLQLKIKLFTIQTYELRIKPQREEKMIVCHSN